MTTRRQILSGLCAAALLGPNLAWAAKDKPPKLALRLAGTLQHRGLPMDRDKVQLRIAAFDRGMGRTVVWESSPTVQCDKGRFETLIKRPSMGVVGDTPLPDTLHLEVWVMEAGPDISEARLIPRIELPWAGDGVAECTLEKEGGIQGLDEGGACVLTGDGAIRLELDVVERVELD